MYLCQYIIKATVKLDFLIFASIPIYIFLRLPMFLETTFLTSNLPEIYKRNLSAAGHPIGLNGFLIDLIGFRIGLTCFPIRLTSFPIGLPGFPILLILQNGVYWLRYEV